MKHLVKGLLFLAAALILGQVPQDTAQAKVNVKGVTVKSNYGKTVHVAVGKRVKLTTTVNVSPNQSAYKKVSYQSSNKRIATVSSSGYVKGVKAGTCSVTVSSKVNRKKKAKITVNVVKKVTSVSIEKPKNPVYVGNSVTLKATVKPESGSYKKVIWSTSDKTVATITSKGVLKGVKAGNVTIKATSVDGTKKSASLRMTVLSTDSVSIASVEVLSENVVRVALDKAKVLTEEQFMLEGKKYSYGNYMRKYSVVQMRNYDNRTYDITLGQEYTIDRDSFVRVTIADLPGNGVKSMESQAVFIRGSNPKEERWLGLVGDKWEKEVDLSDYGCGNISYEVTGSIPGISYQIRNNKLLFSGELTTVTVGTDLVIKGVDELGSTITQIIHVYIGNDITVVAKAKDLTVVTGSEWDGTEFVTALGGSGKYSFSAISMPLGVNMNAEDGTLSGQVSGVGEYTVRITVSDVDNPARTFQTSAKIRVVDQKKVSGTVMDTNGQPVADAVITCKNMTDGTIYTANTNEEGTYVLYIGEGSYDMTATFVEKTDVVYNIAVGSGGRQISFKLEAD